LRVIHIGLVQQTCSEDREANFRNCEEGIRAARDQGAEFIALPLMPLLPFFPLTADYKHFDLAEPVPGPSIGRFAALAREVHAVLLVSLFEIQSPGLGFCTAVLIESDGSLAGIYRQAHIPQMPGRRAKNYFAPGADGIRPIQTRSARIGVLLDWDVWFPEAARLQALAGAEMLIVPSAMGWAGESVESVESVESAEGAEERQKRLDAWTLTLRGHAIANCLPVIAPNRAGIECADTKRATTEHAAGLSTQAAQSAAAEAAPPASSSIHFWGRSLIAGPQGEILAASAGESAEVLAARIDLDYVARVQREWHFYRDRRIDCFEPLCRMGS